MRKVAASLAVVDRTRGNYCSCPRARQNICGVGQQRTTQEDGSAQALMGLSRQKGFCLRRWSAEPCLIKWVIKQTIISLLFFVPLPSLYLPVPSQGRDTRGIPIGYPSDTRDTHVPCGYPSYPGYPCAQGQGLGLRPPDSDTRDTRDTHVPCGCPPCPGDPDARSYGYKKPHPRPCRNKYEQHNKQIWLQY